MLRNSKLRRRRGFGEDTNPMDSLANLVDVMLVFACGLMIAIVTFWNVDLSRVQDIIDPDELVEVDDLDKAIEQGDLTETLQSKGMVYEDPETGKMYVVMP